MSTHPSETVTQKSPDSPRPLIKRNGGGKLYTRSRGIEAMIATLSAMPPRDLLARCQIQSLNDVAYVPNECLMYFVREFRAGEVGDPVFEQLFKILAERVLRRLPAHPADGRNTESITDGAIRDKAFHDFVELIMQDKVSNSEKLDFYEVRFDRAVAKLRADAQRKAWREVRGAVPLEREETGEISAEVEKAVGTFDPFDNLAHADQDYRLRLDAAIEGLPPLQRGIIKMTRQGFPIDSKDPGTMTIAKALNKSEKTIRTHRQQAFGALRLTLTGGLEP